VNAIEHVGKEKVIPSEKDKNVICCSNHEQRPGEEQPYSPPRSATHGSPKRDSAIMPALRLLGIGAMRNGS